MFFDFFLYFKLIFIHISFTYSESVYDTVFPSHISSQDLKKNWTHRGLQKYSVHEKPSQMELEFNGHFQLFSAPHLQTQTHTHIHSDICQILSCYCNCDFLPKTHSVKIQNNLIPLIYLDWNERVMMCWLGNIAITKIHLKCFLIMHCKMMSTYLSLGIICPSEEPCSLHMNSMCWFI